MDGSGGAAEPPGEKERMAYLVHPSPNPNPNPTPTPSPNPNPDPNPNPKPHPNQVPGQRRAEPDRWNRNFRSEAAEINFGAPPPCNPCNPCNPCSPCNPCNPCNPTILQP